MPTGILLGIWLGLAGSASGQSAVDADVLAAMDQYISAGWQEFGLIPSPPATDGEWCRRVFLDLLGRIPRLDELHRFLRNRAPQKKQQLVDQLLSDDRFTSAYARHWTEVWANLLVGRTGGRQRNSLVDRDGLEWYLFATLQANEPYDEFVGQLISATGANSIGSEQFNGAVNFLTGKLADKATQATARAAQLFLGRQVQCTQCHNHPSNDWKQSQFWELNAFFRQTVALRRFRSGTREIRTVELADQDFAGEGTTPAEAEVYYEQRNGLLKAAYPRFVDGQAVSSRSGYLADVNRRQELARLVCGSPMLAEAVVNRMWSHFLGYGFTSPVDDMGPHKPVTHPELFALLCTSFRDHEYDLKWLLRHLVLSRPYALSSRTNNTNRADDPELGEPPQFSRFYLRQMTPEQLYDSLALLAGAPELPPNGSAAPEPTMTTNEPRGAVVSQAKRRWLQQFARALGNDEAGETSTFNGTIPQTLTMFNGPLVQQACRLADGTPLAQWAQSPAPLEQMFLTTVARKPNSNERKMYRKLKLARAPTPAADTKRPGSGGGRNVTAAGSDRAASEALRDMLWAVLNSNEFILNH